jgi:hypothetical protein
VVLAAFASVADEAKWRGSSRLTGPLGAEEARPFGTVSPAGKICLTGKSLICLSSPFRKNILLRDLTKSAS